MKTVRKSISFKDKQRSIFEATKVTQGSDNRDIQLTIMLLSITFALVLLTLPQHVRYVYELLASPHLEDPTARAYARYFLSFQATNLVYMFIIPQISFYIV